MQSAQDTRSVSSEPVPGAHESQIQPEYAPPNPDINSSAGGGSESEESSRQRRHLPWQPEETTAYVLKWTDDEITKTRLNTGAQLRARLRDDGGTPRHLFVLHGLQADHLAALRDVIGIDSSFVEAHVGRRSYRPLRKKTKAAWAHYDYPELVETTPPDLTIGSGGDQEGQNKIASDYVGDAPMFKISAAGDGVVVCRASIWMSEKANVLLLDRPAWGRPSGVRRGRYKAYTATKIPDENGNYEISMRFDDQGNTTILGDEIPSLEAVLYENLRDGCTASDNLLELFEELLISQWGEFFEAFSPDMSSDGAEMTAMFWQLLDSLERNLDGSRQVEKMRHRKFGASYGASKSCNTAEEWEALISRANRRIQLLNHLKPIVANIQAPKHPDVGADVNMNMGPAEGGFDISPTSAAAGKPGDNKYRHRYNYRPRKNYYNSNGTSGSPTDENQRSLNRVAYLGGVLLPFSIVSGILAIEEPFGPGNEQFWVFWAVTIPLMLLTLGVIYADSIRKAEVWMEVATSGKSDSDTDSDKVLYQIPSEVTHEGEEGYEEGRPRRRRRFHKRKRRSTPADLEQAITYEETVVEPVTEMQAEPHNRLAQPIIYYPEERAEPEIRRMAAGPADEEDEVVEDIEEEEEETEEEEEEERVPDTMVEKRWMAKTAPGINDGVKSTNKKWRREELGWAGACATMFQLYKLKKGVPPGHARHDSRYKRTGPGPGQTALRRSKTG